MARGNPLDELESLLDRLSREVAADSLGIGRSIAVDVRDDADAYVVTADLPGFDRDDIEVTVAENVLRIDADRETDETTESGDYLRRERHHESASRSISLPDVVDADDVSASFNGGVLTVTLPKRADSGGTSIDIE